MDAMKGRRRRRRRRDERTCPVKEYALASFDRKKGNGMSQLLTTTLPSPDDAVVLARVVSANIPM